MKMIKTMPFEDWILQKAEINKRDRKELEAYQLNRIIQTIEHAKKHSRFYERELKNIDTGRLHSLKDTRQIPFTYPSQIWQDPFRFLCVPLHDVKRIVTLRSSGTSGKEKRIFFTDDDLNCTVDFFQYGMSCLADQSDRVLVLFPGNAYGSIGDLLQKALKRSGITCFVQGVMHDPDATAEFIKENSITCLVGIPTQILYLSRIKSEVFRHHLKKVLLSSDYVPEILIYELESKYGCQVFTHYGMTEMGYGGGVECTVRNGYHLREANLYFEIINPETGQNVIDGQVGEIVFTTLTRQAMPLIRYRTGDLASISTVPCACGTFLKTMNRVLGRMENRVQIGENQFLALRELDETIYSFPEIIDYQAFWIDEDSLKIEVVTNCSADFTRIQDEISGRIREEIFLRHGCDIRVQVTRKQNNQPEEIANSMVKRKIADLTGDRNENRGSYCGGGHVIPHEPV